MKKRLLLLLLPLLALIAFQKQQQVEARHGKAKKPLNILFAIADDQSYPHNSAYGEPLFQTPVFEQLARNGILFTNAFVAAPQCSPSRAAILTGKNIWQLEEAGTHASYFPRKFQTFTDVLENNGYFTGYTGKGWDPGNFKEAGWNRNPAGYEFNRQKLSSKPSEEISNIDYAANLKEFLSQKNEGQPFFFWFGANEPHREYEKGTGLKSGKNPSLVHLPPFLPNLPEVKHDFLDYALEIDWFDQQLGKMLELLKEKGELENTIVVVTADNGMPFPYAKANLQEYGTHVPLVISVPKGFKGKTVNDLVSLIDLAPTLLELTGQPSLNETTGISFAHSLENNPSLKKTPARTRVLTGRERHSHSRPDNLGYPARAIRTSQYLYIKNYHPERWPLGDPAPTVATDLKGNKDMKPILEGYEDIDNSPSKSIMIQQRSNFNTLFEMGFMKRGSDELYDVQKDPYCLENLAPKPSYKKQREQLKKQLEEALLKEGDPRETGTGDVFESYPRFGLMRPFDGFKERGKYNPAYQQPSSPNIVLILTDDLGWSSFSTGMDKRNSNSASDYHETPNVAAFANQSLRFSRGYAPDPICTPTRRSIQFGQTSIRQGDESFTANYAPGKSSQLSIPQLLKQVNPRYRAAHFGKWDLRANLTPEQLGYDASDGNTGNSDGDLVKEKEEKWNQFYISDNPKQMDSITSRSIRFIHQQIREQHPFYLQVSHYATHVNFETKTSSLEKFKTKVPGKKHNNAAWAGMIYDLDQSIGQLIAEIDRLQLSENTYIFLMADNGGVEFIPPVSNRLDPPGNFPNPMRNYPLRGGKWTLYEGGIRVPFMVRGPGIKAGQSDQPVVGWDLLPTFYDLAGKNPAQLSNIDGSSLASMMLGKKNAPDRTTDYFYFHRYNNSYPHTAIMKGTMKLIKFWKTGKKELYDLSKDLGELQDLSSQLPEISRELEDKLDAYIQTHNPELIKKIKKQ